MSKRGTQVWWPLQPARSLPCASSCGYTFTIFILFPCEQYQLALHQIDSLRKDGKFVGADGSTPEGQGIVMAHLNECHELLEMVGFPSRSFSRELTHVLQLKEAMDECDEYYDDDDNVEAEFDEEL
jgi:hypothetical protein